MTMQASESQTFATLPPADKISPVCPQCRSANLRLEFEQDAQRAIFRCAECSETYPVINGIPRFVPQDNYADSFGYQWNIHRGTQLDSFTGLALTADRLFAATGWPRQLDGQTVLECGSGAGRFTEVIARTGAELYTFDLSKAVDANKSNNGSFERVRFAQADIFSIPFPRAAFDQVVCLGVIQHTPDPSRAFTSLASHVKPGGWLTIDCYPKTLKGMISWKYLLRPVTRHMKKERLYGIIEAWAPKMIPLSIGLRKVFGKAGPRLLPILEYNHWGVKGDLNRLWCILDTFDMYSPQYDFPQTLGTIREWFYREGFEEIQVIYGLNGVVGRGRKPIIAAP